MNTTSYNNHPHGHAPAHVQARALNVLIACEESQAETTAFRLLGHNAFSCDIQPCRPSGQRNWHIMADVTPFLQHDIAPVMFQTMDGQQHIVEQWDLIICHPPCTYLCKVSSPHMIHNGILDENRYAQMKKAREFFFLCLDAPAPYVAVENPLPMARAQLPPPSTYIQPFWYGVKYSKKTLYWLKNLPPPLPTIEYPNPRCYVHSSRGKYRSRTFSQVAKALAEQWSQFIINDLKQQQI